MLNDRRNSARHRVFVAAALPSANGHSVIDCVVLDLSTGGARLRVGSWLGMPNRFELRIENGPAREAQVRFRNHELAGIQFVDRAA